MLADKIVGTGIRTHALEHSDMLSATYLRLKKDNPDSNQEDKSELLQNCLLIGRNVFWVSVRPGVGLVADHPVSVGRMDGRERNPQRWPTLSRQ